MSSLEVMPPMASNALKISFCALKIVLGSHIFVTLTEVQKLPLERSHNG